MIKNILILNHNFGFLPRTYYIHLKVINVSRDTQNLSRDRTRDTQSSVHSCDVMKRAVVDGKLFYRNGYYFNWYTVLWNILDSLR